MKSWGVHPVWRLKRWWSFKAAGPLKFHGTWRFYLNSIPWIRDTSVKCLQESLYSGELFHFTITYSHPKLARFFLFLLFHCLSWLPNTLTVKGQTYPMVRVVLFSITSWLISILFPRWVRNQLVRTFEDLPNKNPRIQGLGDISLRTRGLSYFTPVPHLMLQTCKTGQKCPRLN